MRRGVDDTSFYWESCIYFFFTSLLLLYLSVYIMKHNKIVGYKQNYTTRTPMQINLTKCSSLTRSNLKTFWCEATWTCEVRRRPAGRSIIYLSWLNNGRRCCFCCRIHITNITWLSAVLDWVVGGANDDEKQDRNESVHNNGRNHIPNAMLLSWATNPLLTPQSQKPRSIFDIVSIFPPLPFYYFVQKLKYTSKNKERNDIWQMKKGHRRARLYIVYVGSSPNSFLAMLMNCHFLPNPHQLTIQLVSVGRRFSDTILLNLPEAVLRIKIHSWSNYSLDKWIYVI
jgi:hypothetical protein